jgi:LysR family hydrogen peroxide-inducible transcriptional activator
MPSRPTIRHLECAVAVAETLNFHRAARAVAVSQPALSAQVAQFEELLGVQVFERTRQKVLLTDAGQEVITRARDILASVDALGEAARCRTEPLTGPLRLGVIPTVAPYLLPRVLPAVREQHPRLSLFLREDQTARLVALLAEGRLDAAIVALPLAGIEAAEQPMFDDEFLLAAPPEHILARGRAIREHELDGTEVLLLEDGHCLRDQALAVCGGAGMNEARELQATSLTTLIEMVASGLGITLLPALAADSARQAGVTLRRFELPRPSRRIGLAWRASSPRVAEYKLLAELIATEARRLGLSSATTPRAKR